MFWGFNHRALELIEILGGSLTITREDPLWEEYLQKLPEVTANITQQAHLMCRIQNISLTLSDMHGGYRGGTNSAIPPRNFVRSIYEQL